MAPNGEAIDAMIVDKPYTGRNSVVTVIVTGTLRVVWKTLQIGIGYEECSLQVVALC